MAAHLLMSQKHIDRDRDEWLRVRQNGITASEIASIMGLAPGTQSSAWKVFLAKSTGEHFDADTDATLRGTHLEPYVADRFQAESGMTLTDGGLYASTLRPWQMATFDRRTFDAQQWPDAKVPVQIKTSATHDGWGDPGTDEIPVHYRCQCLWEMDVAGTDLIYVPCLFMHTWKVVVYRIRRTPDAETDIEIMRMEAEAFRRRLQDGDPPPVDWTPATTAALRTLHPGEPNGTVEIPIKLARQYKAARKSVAAAERRLGQATNEILYRAGDAKYILTHDGDRVASRSRSPRRTHDVTMLREKFPEAAKATQRTRDTTTLWPGTWAKSSSEDDA